MGAGIAAADNTRDAAGSATILAAQDLAPLDWGRVAEQASSYLQAMGVRDPTEIGRLWGEVRTRLESRAASAPLEDPSEAAIEETLGLLDQWLSLELGIEGDANHLYRARAAVLGGGVPGWSARWAGLSGRSLAPQIQALCAPAVPDPAPLVMEANPIELCCHRLGCRIGEAFGGLLCRRDSEGKHSGEPR